LILGRVGLHGETNLVINHVVLLGCGGSIAADGLGA
jgi:hypothetical protein